MIDCQTMSSNKGCRCRFPIPTKSGKRSLNLTRIHADSPDNLTYILQKSRKILLQNIRRYRTHWQPTPSWNRSRLQRRRRATLAMILLHNINTKQTLPIRMCHEEYDTTGKILGYQFCEFLADTGIAGGKNPA